MPNSIQIQTKHLSKIIQLLIEEDRHNDKFCPKNEQGFNVRQVSLLTSFRAGLIKEIFIDKHTRDMLLMDICYKLKDQKYVCLFNYIIQLIFQLELTNDEWSNLLAVKNDIFNFFQTIALQTSQNNLKIMMNLMLDLEEETRLQIICGMSHYEDTKNCIKYSISLVNNMTSVLALMDETARGKFFIPRDEEGRNVLAYAIHGNQHFLAQLILDHAEYIEPEDNVFLLNPTYSVEENICIHLHILQDSKLLIALKKTNDLETIKDLLMIKNQSNQTSLEILLHELSEIKIELNLHLIKKLKCKDQQEVISQLSSSGQQKLAEFINQHKQLRPIGDDYPMIEDQKQRNTSPLFFKSASVSLDKLPPSTNDIRYDNA